MVIRTCVGCRQRVDKTTLVRVVAGKDGAKLFVQPDLGGSLPGRGAHLHPATRCFELARDRRAFSRALRIEGQLGTEVLQAWIQSCSSQRA
ncbi:MAG TPA: YlxR family protein [Aeromicrobium sp.]|nr:YlxR family protein [Aeromicrobium sp.]